jgi:hypothetical protein
MKNYTWDYIQKHPQETKRLLGIDYEQLKQLVAPGKFLHQRNQEEREKTKIRLIRIGKIKNWFSKNRNSRICRICSNN